MEVRPVPPYQRQQITRMWWYCLYCCHSETGEYGVKGHIKREHLVDYDQELHAGEDYTNGDHLLILMERWQDWAEKQATRFALSLDSLRGADDFEHEVGGGVPDA